MLVSVRQRTRRMSARSQPDLPPLDRDVRFAALNGLKSDIAPCPKSANIGTHAPQQSAELFDHLAGPVAIKSLHITIVMQRFISEISS